MQKSSCCFTGHRHLPNAKIETITERLCQEIDKLIARGVTDFISGGALGFDQIAASQVISKKEAGYSVRLIFALPCKNQDERWSIVQKQKYYELLDKADSIIYVSKKYTTRCMKKRNFYMVDRSAYCICAS